MEALQLHSLRTGGWLLIIGAAVFWAGAFAPPYKQWMAPLKEYLAIIHNHPLNWQWINWCMLGGVSITLIALVSMYPGLTGDAALYSRLAVWLYGLGVVFWIISLVFRVSVEPWAATEWITNNALPSGFEAWHRWSGTLFTVYMVMAYIAVGLLGIGFLQSAFLPNWTNWIVVGFGFLGAIGFVVRFIFFDPPLMIHLPLLFLGIMILVKVHGPATP